MLGHLDREAAYPRPKRQLNFALLGTDQELQAQRGWGDSCAGLYAPQTVRHEFFLWLSESQLTHRLSGTRGGYHVPGVLHEICR